jgi:very-short-patch-repair endonuclease
MRSQNRRARKFAGTLRKTLTSAETILWTRLRLHRLREARFRRQHPVGPYIADFACVSAQLIVEVDGVTHSSDAERRYDEKRDRFLCSRGWRVMRVSNVDVYENLEAVLTAIDNALPPSRPSAGLPP